MLVKQFIPKRNFVLVERTHEIDTLLLRSKDPDIPAAHTVTVVAIGPDVKSIAIGETVHMTPQPYEMFYIEFEDNAKDLFKLRKTINDEFLSRTKGGNIILPTTKQDINPIVTGMSTKTTFVTYVMIQDRDIIASILPVE